MSIETKIYEKEKAEKFEYNSEIFKASIYYLQIESDKWISCFDFEWIKLVGDNGLISPLNNKEVFESKSQAITASLTYLSGRIQPLTKSSDEVVQKEAMDICMWILEIIEEFTKEKLKKDTCMTELKKLSKTERNQKRLNKLEIKIQNGINSVIEIGKALKEINQEKLYRVKYETFNIYCSEVWNLEKSYAYRLIKLAEVSENIVNLSPMGDTLDLPNSERQIRELAKLSPHEQAKIWNSLLSEKKSKITEKEVKKQIEDHKKSKERKDFESTLQNQIGKSEPEKNTTFINEDYQEKEIIIPENYSPPKKEKDTDPEHQPGEVKEPEEIAKTILEPRQEPELKKSIDLSFVSMNNQEVNNVITELKKITSELSLVAEINDLRNFMYEFKCLTERLENGAITLDIFDSVEKSFRKIKNPDFIFDALEKLVKKVEGADI